MMTPTDFAAKVQEKMQETDAKYEFVFGNTLPDEPQLMFYASDGVTYVRYCCSSRTIDDKDAGLQIADGVAASAIRRIAKMY